MINRYGRFVVGALLVGSMTGSQTVRAEDKIAYQYEFEQIAIPAATADEPKLAEFSLARAADYIEQANFAWWKKRKCVACHTSGAYLLSRPALTPKIGKPSNEIRDFYVDALTQKQAKQRAELLRGIAPTQMAYIAGGLAEWDAHVRGNLSAETEAALRLMFELQGEDGSWGNTTCWPPFESSSYHGTTVAAMAAATAPEWLENLSDQELLAKVDKMKKYLRTTKPPHDYGRLLLLWTSTRLPNLLEAEQQQELIACIWKHQREDGGWSIRTFATPAAWGSGNRAEKLRAEPEFKNPPSDGHQTGLAILVLRDAGVPADDGRIRRGVNWLLQNQRQSGRWWTRSLNTDRYHFITFSGSCYPLLALSRCDALPKSQPTSTASLQSP